jgi:hypothetical protein
MDSIEKMSDKKDLLTEVCQVKDCNNIATKILRNFKVCEDCYIKCVYDMQPLVFDSTKCNVEKKIGD